MADNTYRAKLPENPFKIMLGLKDMEQYSFNRVEGGLHIEGFPDAVKLIMLDGPKARRISDLVLHRDDLEFADACLKAINGAPVEPPTVREALWRSAIVHFAKCFSPPKGGAARSQLNCKKIYKKEWSEAKPVFKYFKDLRNKHVVHDENSYSQCITGAALNGGDKSYKIEKILCFEAHVHTLEQSHYGQLKLLIQKALVWVESEFDKCCEALTKELESLQYDELLERSKVVYRVPGVEEIGGDRRSKP